MTDQRERELSNEPSERDDPIDSTEPNDPIEPTERVEPTDPIDRNDPDDAIERNELRDQSDHLDAQPGTRVMPQLLVTVRARTRGTHDPGSPVSVIAVLAIRELQPTVRRALLA
jgi:hypothetical protein